MTKKKAISIVKRTIFGFMVFMGIISLITGSNISKTAQAESVLDVETVSADISAEISAPQSVEVIKKEVLSAERDELNIHFIDVGQGDATLITCGTHAMLIDAGNNDKGTAVQLYLNKRGIGDGVTLDYVIGTHPDADHAGGLDVVITKFDIGTILLSDYTKDTKTYTEVLEAIAYRNYKKTAPVVGKSYSLGDAGFTIIAPNKSNYTEANDSSIGILLTHGNKRFLFSGDAEQGAEADIIKNGIDIGNIDIYKVAHHGSSTASSKPFLSAMNPEYAVISLGEGNSYGHPHADVLNNLRSAGVKLFRTDEQGSIIATSDGENITWNCAPTESWLQGEATGQNKKSTPAPVTPAASEAIESTIVHITKTGECYHNAGCDSLSKSDREVTLDEAKEKGLRACKRCDPVQ